MLTLDKFEEASEKGAFSSVQEVNRNREKINSKAYTMRFKKSLLSKCEQLAFAL